MPAKRHRITRGDDYRRAVRHGKRAGGSACITHVQPRESEAPARFGFIVSKAVGNAVTRNLVRRRMKTIADRSIASGIGGVDVVFRALPAASTIQFSELESQLNRALTKLISGSPHRLEATDPRREGAS